MDVEAVSVSYVQLTMGQCPHLTPYIAQKDKGPHTDGYIDVRSDEGQPKDTNFTHRAYVQVKGRTLGRGRKPPKKFSLKREKLQAYLKIQGVLLLVVWIGADHSKHVRYSTLTPIDLDQMLKENPKKPSISFPTKPLPEEHADIEAVVRYMAQAHKESPEAMASERTWEHASDISVIASHRLDTSKPIRLNPDEHDYTVKLTTNDGAQAFARGEGLLLVPQSYIGTPVGKPIRSGNVVFEDASIRRVSEDTIALDLSETLSIHHSEAAESEPLGALKWGLNPSFDKRLKDLGFLLSSLDNGGYYVGETFVGWTLASIDEEDSHRCDYRHLQRTAELFEHIGARTDLIDLSQLDDKRHSQLWNLYEAVVEKKEMFPHDKSRPGRVLQPVGDWVIDLLVRKGTEEGKFRVRHLLDPELQHVFYEHNESHDGPAGFPVSAYEVLKRDGELHRVLNLGLDRVVDIYRDLSEYNHTNDSATQTVLSFINAADKAPARKEEFLCAAEALNNWLVSKYGQASHNVINDLQIQHRRRALTPDERSKLRELRREVIRENAEASEALAFSCSVLLGDMEDAADHLHGFPAWLQELIKEWPIWSLWQQPEG